MQLQSETRLTGLRAFAASIRCPYCGDPMVAPEMSEFVAGGEIRHHWECEGCGRASRTCIAPAAKKWRNHRNR